MKKRTKRILLILAIVFIIIPGLIFGGFYLKLRQEIKGIKISETVEIAAGVYSIKDGYANMFIFKDSSNYIAIDAGNDIDVVTAGLKTLNLDPDKVIAVLLTHSDGDHIAALKLFKNAKIYLATEEIHMMNGDNHKFLWFNNKLNADYTPLEDGQIISVNNTKIQGILTPGHSTGSMCYLLNDKYLFVGDAASLMNGKIAKPNEFFSMDIETAKKSLVKITALPNAEYIFTSHYGFTADYANAVKDWKWFDLKF
jgi:glyoxylase-like metal-dependent hydrolase (beta-lactamase superfamily II)